MAHTQDETLPVIVVGAGLAGLTAAGHLRAAGVEAVVCEAGDRVGGRVGTDLVDGFRLDRGFQVLLPAYPRARREFDLAALRLRPLTRGVISVAGGRRRVLAPPWRDPAALLDLPGFAGRHPRDAIAVAAMSARDLGAPDRTMRALADRPTSAELAGWGISPGTVREVFAPFLAGVFLDPTLRTSSRVFHLIWRSFLRGGAALPALGMAELPHQLAAALPPGTVRLDSPVAEITGDGVRLAGGEWLPARAVVVATDATTAAALLPEVDAPDWHPTTTYYFAAGPSPLTAPTLLVDGQSDLMLNTVVLSDVAPDYAPPGRSLVAASVPGRLDEPGLAERVSDRLTDMYGRVASGWDLIATCPVEHALPAMPPERPLRRPVRLGGRRYVCGDHRDTSSIQGALASGARAARAVLADLTG